MTDGNRGISNEFLMPSERELMYYLLRYGEYDLVFDENLLYGNEQKETVTVFQYVAAQLEEDSLVFANDIYRKMFGLYAAESAAVNRDGGDAAQIQERIQRAFINNQDENVSREALELIVQKYNITIEEFNKALTPEDNILGRLIPKAVVMYKARIVDWEYNKTSSALGEAQHTGADFDRQMELMQYLQNLMKLIKILVEEVSIF
ncbi:MAG: hypothetical protein KBS57_01010 [Alistipes sp.]|nr:hypothetical protein [Candidatus Minthomonas equi]